MIFFPKELSFYYVAFILVALCQRLNEFIDHHAFKNAFQLKLMSPLCLYTSTLAHLLCSTAAD